MRSGGWQGHSWEGLAGWQWCRLQLGDATHTEGPAPGVVCEHCYKSPGVLCWGPRKPLTPGQAGGHREGEGSLLWILWGGARGVGT